MNNIERAAEIAKICRDNYSTLFFTAEIVSVPLQAGLWSHTVPTTPTPTPALKIDSDSDFTLIPTPAPIPTYFVTNHLTARGTDQHITGDAMFSRSRCVERCLLCSDQTSRSEVTSVLKFVKPESQNENRISKSKSESVFFIDSDSDSSQNLFIDFGSDFSQNR